MRSAESKNGGAPKQWGPAVSGSLCLCDAISDYDREFILKSHRKIEKCSVQELRQTRRRTQAGLTPGKDDNEV